VRVLVIAGFVLFVLSVTIPFTSLASTHPCASPTPPPVTGTTPVQPPAASGNLFINEVLLNPQATWNCSEVGTSTSINDAWVEIYNSQNVAYDLFGVNAALDSGPGTNPSYFPMGSVIAAHSFLVVFPRIGNGLFPTTTTLRLLIAGSVVVDEMNLPTLNIPTDTSYARTPDGSNTWQLLTTPTIDASNLLPQITATPFPTSHRTSVTPTPHTARKSSSTNNNSQDTSATAGGQADTTQTTSTSLPLVDGSQPTWNKMPMPDFTSPSPTAVTNTTTATTTSTVQAPKTDSADITTKKIVITLVAIALACSLTWCWKLFTSPDPRKQKG
jgi:hypothetical protein